jgi:flagella synthesis protein FlgN
VKPGLEAASLSLEALQTEREAAARFVELLRREQHALSAGSVDELDAITPMKARMADQLARYVGARRAHLVRSGLTPDVRGMRSWVAAHAESSKATAIWESLHALAGQAKALNETNGMLIEMRLQHCERSLVALNEACGRTTLYGPQGHTVAAVGGGTSLRA